MGYGMGPDMFNFVDPTWFVVLAVWSLVWKGLGLWHSAQHKHKIWFVALLVINTLGILEIIYLFVVLKKKLADLFPIGKIK